MARNLRLQVMLNAVDRVTGPLKRMREGAGKTGQAMRETRDQLKELQRTQSDVTSYRKNQAAMRTTNRAMADARTRNHQYTQALDRQREAHAGIKSGLTVARREYDRLAKELLQTKQPTDQLTASLERARVRLHGQQTEFDRSARSMREYRNRTRNAGEEVKRLTQNHATQTERIRGLKTRLDEAGISTDNLGRSARELRTREERLNTALQEQKRRLSDVAAQQRRLTAARDRHQNSMGNVARAQGVGGGMLGTGLAQGYAASRLVRPGIAWAEQMATLQAVGRFNADDEGFLALRQQSRDLGASTAFSATEVGAGQEFLLRAGMSAGAIKASMQDVLALSLANNTELARAADIASNIAGAFKVDMEAEGTMARVADILSGTASRANVNLEMLGETMKYLGGAEDLKLTMEQAAAMAGLLGNIGIQGSQAGTTMRGMMNRLTNPVGKGAAAIHNMGLEVADASGMMRAMPDILRDISQATASLGNVERKAIMQNIFGVEAGSGMSELVDAMSGGRLDDLIAALGDNLGENARMASVMADNIGGDLKNLKSAWEEVGISITDTNDGPLRELVQNITDITRGVGEWIKANPELAGTIAKLATGLIALATVGGAITMTMASILGPLLFTRFAMTTLGIKASGLGAALGWLAKTAIPWVLGALKSVGVALLATPVGWFLLGVAAIAGAAYLLYKYWEPIKAFFSGLWNQVKTAFSEGIGGVTRLLVNWSPFGLLWAGVSSAIGRMGIELPATLSELGAGMIEGLSTGITSGLGLAREAVDGIWSSINSAFDAGISGITQLLINWSPFGLLYNAMMGAVERLGISVPEGFSNLGSMIVDGIIGGITSKLGDLRASITGAASSAVGWFKDRLDIHSPSRVFAQLGGYTMQGLANGIESESDSPLKQVRSLASQLRNAAGGLMLSAGIASPALALDIQAPTLPAMPALYSELAAPDIPKIEVPTLDALRIQRPTLPALPELSALKIQRPTLPALPELNALQIQRPTLPELPTLEALAFQWPELPQFDPLRIDTSGVQIDARPPLQSHTSEQQSGGLHIHGGINISVQATPGMNEQSLARMVGEQVQRALRDAERSAAAANRRNFYDND